MSADLGVVDRHPAERDPAGIRTGRSAAEAMHSMRTRRDDPALRAAEVQAPVSLRKWVLTVPVSDLERTRQYYRDLGWQLDAERVVAGVKAVQFTPPHSTFAVMFSKGLVVARPGTNSPLALMVENVHTAREDLLRRGIHVSRVSGCTHPEAELPHVTDDGEHRCNGHAWFVDPDETCWLLQERRKEHHVAD